MHLSSISIINYKNLSEIELNLSPKINCLIGSNGMGKTNLLDAIYYLSFCKSTTNLSDTQNIQHDFPFFLLKGKYTGDDGEFVEISCGLKRGEKKQFKRDKKNYERLSDHIGFIPLVMISPADQELIVGGGDERRRFLDVVISQYDREYLQSLIKYNKALQQRNALLRGENAPSNEMLELFEDMMLGEACMVSKKREEFVNDLNIIFQSFHTTITKGAERVTLKYRSDAQYSNLATVMRQNRDRDRKVGYTTKGIHRDELVMELDGYPIRREGSQGQNKSYLVALKLAQFDFLRHRGGKTPLLLLDDIFDKLDANRVEEIVKLVSSDRFGQIFITDVNREHLDTILQRTEGAFSLFQVENGKIELIKKGID